MRVPEKNAARKKKDGGAEEQNSTLPEKCRYSQELTNHKTGNAAFPPVKHEANPDSVIVNYHCYRKTPPTSLPGSSDAPAVSQKMLADDARGFSTVMTS